jgi:hypothetical protein
VAGRHLDDADGPAVKADVLARAELKSVAQFPAVPIAGRMAKG